jgi:hypothetical protein
VDHDVFTDYHLSGSDAKQCVFGRVLVAGDVQLDRYPKAIGWSDGTLEDVHLGGG